MSDGKKHGSYNPSLIECLLLDFEENFISFVAKVLDKAIDLVDR